MARNRWMLRRSEESNLLRHTTETPAIPGAQVSREGTGESAARLNTLVGILILAGISFVGGCSGNAADLTRQEGTTNDAGSASNLLSSSSSPSHQTSSPNAPMHSRDEEAEIRPQVRKHSLPGFSPVEIPDELPDDVDDETFKALIDLYKGAASFD